jgi:hypothetical protein
LSNKKSSAIRQWCLDNFVEEACRIGGKDGCFILGTSDSIRENTPIENIDAYFKYARKYGKIQ